MSSHAANPNFVPAMGVKDTLSEGFIHLSGLALSGVEAAAVAIVDGSGNQITTFGGGTQYTDGQATPANATGPTLQFDDGGTWKTVGSADPLPVSATLDTTGLATSAKQDTGNTSLASIDTKTPSLGQALATASVPVVLTASQLSTLTPLSSVTVTQGTGSNLHAVIDSGTVSTITNVVHVDDNSSSLTVDNGGTFAVQATIADGASTTLGAKADAKSTATDTTAVTIMQVLKEISFMEQNPASRAVTNAGTFAVQVDGSALTSLQLIDDIVATLGTTTYTETSTKGAVIGAVRHDSISTLVNTENEIAPLQVNSDGRLWVTAAIENATLAVTQSGTWNVGSSITGLGHGVTTVTTAGTDVALAASTTCKRVVIQAQTDNTSVIAVGASGVDAAIATGTGIILYPGDSFELETDNLADIFIDSLVNGEGVRYTYFT